MSLTDKPFALLITLILLTGGVSFAVAQESPLNRLHERLAGGKVFHAQFIHRLVDTYTGDTTMTSGTLWVAEEKYKVRNRQRIVVVDGEVSRIYDNYKNRVIIASYEPEDDDFAPSRFFSGVDSTYTLQEQQTSGDETLITLGSEDPFASFKKVEITLAAGLKPVKIFALDSADNLNTITFSQGAFIDPEEGLFVLDYPADAEIIDMRKQAQ